MVSARPCACLSVRLIRTFDDVIDHADIQTNGYKNRLHPTTATIKVAQQQSITQSF